MSLATLAQLLRHHRQAALHWLQRHPRQLYGAVLALLAGFGATALAIAPLAPDAADLPRRQVQQALELPGLAEQADTLAAHSVQLWRSDTSRATDTADTLLRRLGVADPLAARFLRTDRDARRLLEGRAGKMLRARTEADGTLVELVARFPALDSAQQGSHFSRLTLTKQHGAWASRLEQVPLQARQQLGSGTVRSTLFAAIDDARLPDAVATQLAEAFANDIDFQRELRRGDTFSVVYEALFADDQPITWGDGIGQVLAAEFVNNGQAHSLVLFEHNGRSAYYGFDGQSQQRAFLGSPLEFSRMTSGFAMRVHPITRAWKAHLGVDYAAPHGTPVRSVGEGVVDFAGRQSGYGNVVSIRHSGGRSTLYAHLSEIHVQPGQKVQQGQRIGEVGATGFATGPHLHFEFKVGGEHVDPLEVARAAETVALDAAARTRFNPWAAQLQAQLKLADTLRGYQGLAE